MNTTDTPNITVGTGLDCIERRGTLTYRIGTECFIMEGNFQLSFDGKTVEARKTRGRNRYQLCSACNVISFEEVK